MAPTPCEFIAIFRYIFIGIAKHYLSFYTGAGYATDIYGQAVATSLTSELEGDKMVLKICKPPRDKDSMVALTWQCCTWVVAVSFPRLLFKWQCCIWVVAASFSAFFDVAMLCLIVAVSFPAFFQVGMLFLGSCGKFSRLFFK